MTDITGHTILNLQDASKRTDILVGLLLELMKTDTPTVTEYAGIIEACSKLQTTIG